MRAQDGGGGSDQRIEVVVSFGACAPAIGEHVGIEDIGGGHARAVVEGGAQHAIGQLLFGNPAGANRQ